jgi:hypothetical protein
MYGQHGISVEEMVASYLRYHMEFGPDDSDWIVELDQRRAEAEPNLCVEDS